MKSLFLYLFISCIFAISARASCGLQGCPYAPHGEKGFKTQVDVQPARFRINSVSGSYTEIRPRLEYRSGSRWIVGGYVPLVYLSLPGENHSGMGNPVVFGEYRLFRSVSRIWSLGSQVEAPLGDDENGIASNHGEWLPYLSLHQNSFGFHSFNQIGFRWTLSESHGHGAGESPLFVNPHEDKEVVYRTGIQWQKSSRLLPQFFLDGQHALDGEENKGTGYLTGGLLLRFPLKNGSHLNTFFEAPLTSPRRIEWRWGLGYSF